MAAGQQRDIVPKDRMDLTRDHALDGLRGIAIVLVLVMHTLHFESVRPLWSWVNSMAKAGWMGVDLFFVLSGFLITRVLLELREAPNRLSVFYGRRALRILPSYFFYLLLAVTMLLLFTAPKHVALTREMLPWLLLFLQNFHAALSDPGTNLGPLSHLWSLAVEEQFYILWPFVVWYVRTENLARVALGFGMLAVLCKLLLAALNAAPHISYVLTLTRMDGFAAGAWLAAGLATGCPPPRWFKPLAWLAALLLLAVLVIDGNGSPKHAWPMALSLSLTPLVFAGWLHGALSSAPDSRLRRVLGQPVLKFFGRHSYALYLVHPGISILLLQLLMPLLRVWVPGNTGRLILILLTWLLSIALSLLVDRLIDAPARRLKQRLRAAGPVPQTSRAAFG